VKSEDTRKLREAAQVLLAVLRCVSMKRALSASSHDTLNFYKLYDGCLMDITVISWCKLFGSDRESLHWTKLIAALGIQDRDLFLVQLDEAAGDKFESLSESSRNYRDTYAAHHDLDTDKRTKQYPVLEPLRATAHLLYSAVWDFLNNGNAAYRLPMPDVLTGNSLRKIELGWSEIAKASRRGTHGLTEPD